MCLRQSKAQTACDLDDPAFIFVAAVTRLTERLAVFVHNKLVQECPRTSNLDPDFLVPKSNKLFTSLICTAIFSTERTERGKNFMVIAYEKLHGFSSLPVA